jgi:hypothetical protein
MELDRCRECGERVLATDMGMQELPDADGNDMYWYVTEFACECQGLTSKVDYDICISRKEPHYYRTMIDVSRYYRKWFSGLVPEDLL